MMRQIDLLPAAHAERKRQKRNLATIMVVGLLALLLMFGYWLFLGLQISDANNELADVRSDNAELQAQIDELRSFAELAAELDRKRGALRDVFAGDVDWPAIMTEIGMVVPGEVWLTSLTASAGETEGAAPVGTETAPVRIDRKQPFGRIAFQGRALSMPGVARWMLRLESVREFFAVFLNSATSTEEEGGLDIVTFDNTLELSDDAASRRFQGRIR